jgi:hypothetical protein
MNDELSKLEQKSQPVIDWIKAHPKFCWTVLAVVIVLVVGIKIGTKFA